MMLSVWITGIAGVLPEFPKKYSGRIGYTLISPDDLPNDTPTDYKSAGTGQIPTHSRMV